MKSYTLPIVVEKDSDGYFVACPSLQGCFSQGATYGEAVANIRDATKLHIQDRVESGDPIPIPEMVGVSTLEVVA